MRTALYFTRVASIGLVLFCSCVSYRVLRASSADHLTPPEADVSINASVGELSVAITDLFRARGFDRVQEVPGADGSKVLVFRGERQQVTSVAGNRTMVVAQSNNIGSWFAVSVVPEGDTAALHFLGKPTLNGQEVCADGDARFSRFNYACVDSSIREDFPGAHLVTGREEAAAIRAVILDLRDRSLPDHGSQVPSARTDRI